MTQPLDNLITWVTRSAETLTEEGNSVRRTSTLKMRWSVDSAGRLRAKWAASPSPQGGQPIRKAA